VKIHGKRLEYYIRSEPINQSSVVLNVPFWIDSQGRGPLFTLLSFLLHDSSRELRCGWCIARRREGVRGAGTDGVAMGRREMNPGVGKLT